MIEFFISIAVGICQAFIFNPIDKAIYNSVINNRKLFIMENWKNPFVGASNGIYSRIITGGIYFYLLDYTKEMNIYQSSFVVSLTTSIISNPFNVVKFNSYIENKSSYNSLLSCYKKYGLKFGKIGIESLIIRDFIFNVVYLKYKKDNEYLFHNCCILCAASVISSPFHYVRNMKYYNNDRYLNICKNLFKDIKQTNNKLTFAIKQFAIGYGTIRTIASVYIGQIMYSTLKEMVPSH
jgi:hypothetical protein